MWMLPRQERKQAKIKTRQERKQAMSISYFRRQAAQCFRGARASGQMHLDYESLMRRARRFKAKATTAQRRLAGMQARAARWQEAKRQEGYRDSRE
jgi:hypothetical protein